MIAEPPVRHSYTVEKYLEWDEASDIRHEYRHGEIIALSGASEPHNDIVGNLLFQMKGCLRERGGKVFANDMRVKVKATGLYTYPDITVICGEREYEHRRGVSLLNPDLLIEVLSPSTQSYDRIGKFREYQQILSLQEYILVASREKNIVRHTRQTDGTWTTATFTADADTIALSSIGCTLNLAETYADVDFRQAV